MIDFEKGGKSDISSNQASCQCCIFNQFLILICKLTQIDKYAMLYIICHIVQNMTGNHATGWRLRHFTGNENTGCVQNHNTGVTGAKLVKAHFESLHECEIQVY